MRTVSVSLVKKVVVALLLVLTSATISVNAQQLLAFNDVKQGYNEEIKAQQELPFNEQVKNIGNTITKYIETSVNNEVGKSVVFTGKYYFNVELCINRTGQVVDFKFNKDENEKLSNILSGVLSKAPVFESVKVNGNVIQMHYQIPVTIVVR